ncbi:beta-Ala-His dipeptidase [Candidatus Poribacteria bacterium]
MYGAGRKTNSVVIYSFIFVLLLFADHVTIHAQIESGSSDTTLGRRAENVSNQNDFFEPKAVNDHFIEITKMPRPSGKEDPVREYIADYARKNGIEIKLYKPDATEPGERVIVLYRPGTGEHKDKAPVVLQAHLDMMCYPNDDIFPLKLFKYKDDQGVEWLKAGDLKGINDPAKGTTLGADDGIGVATALAVLEDDKLKDYPIECLFTVQEETGMDGAKDFDKNLLRGRRFINLDAGPEKVIIYGCAGGCVTHYEGSVSYLDNMPDGYKAVSVSIYGLRSGHSGVDINKGRLNAIKVLTDALIRLNGRITDVSSDVGDIGGFDILLCSMYRDEEAKNNAIPARARVVIALPEEDAEGFENGLNVLFSALKTQNKEIEEGFSWDFSQEDNKALPMDRRSTDALLCILRQIPHGVIKMIPERSDLVETSTNLCEVKINGNKVIINSLDRSSSNQSMEALLDMHQNIGTCFDFSVSIEGDRFPAWQPNESSTLLSKAKKVYAGAYGDESEATVVHAGVECAWIAQRFDGEMDCISIGPNTEGLHTGAERLQTSTVKMFYDTLSNLLVSLFEE